VVWEEVDGLVLCRGTRVVRRYGVRRSLTISVWRSLHFNTIRMQNGSWIHIVVLETLCSLTTVPCRLAVWDDSVSWNYMLKAISLNSRLDHSPSSSISDAPSVLHDCAD